MANVLPPLNMSRSSSSSLAPLDFSALPTFAESSFSPSCSGFLLSPLCGTSALRSPLFTDPFLNSPSCHNNLFSLSPLPSVQPPSQSNDWSPVLPSPQLEPALFDSDHSTTSLSTLVNTPPTPQQHQPIIQTSSSPLIATPPQTNQHPSSPQPKQQPKLTPAPSIDKAAERRRKNRESSSRCYYNRKRIIQTLEKELLQEKQKLTMLYDKALQLRHDNARLKKEVVTKGYALPTAPNKNVSASFSMRDYLQLLHHSTYHSAHALS